MAKTNFEKLMEDKNYLASVLTDDCDNCPAYFFCEKQEGKSCIESKRAWLDESTEPSKETKLRAEILEKMDEYLRTVDGDENHLERWLMCGLPDGHTHDEVLEIAEDDKEFRRMSYAFGKLIF